MKSSLEAGAYESTEDKDVSFWGDCWVVIGMDWGVSLFING